MTGQSPLDRPVLITGPPRSGKTLVRLLLEQSPEFLVRIEPGPVWETAAHGRPDAIRGAADATARVRARIRDDCRVALDRSGRSRYADELSHHALRLCFVHAVMPEAKIVHVLRNPESTIPEMAYWWGRPAVGAGAIRARVGQLSRRSLPRLALRFARNRLSSRLRGRAAAWGPAVPGLAAFAADHSPAEIAAFQWAAIVECAIRDTRQLPDGCLLELRYEDLTRSPVEQIRRLATFCEISDASRFVEAGARLVDPDALPYASVEPSREEWDRIWKIVRPIAESLGYSHDPQRVGRTILPGNRDE